MLLSSVLYISHCPTKNSPQYVKNLGKLLRFCNTRIPFGWTSSWSVGTLTSTHRNSITANGNTSTISRRVYMQQKPREQLRNKEREKEDLNSINISFSDLKTIPSYKLPTLSFICIAFSGYFNDVIKRNEEIRSQKVFFFFFLFAEFLNKK